MLLIGLGRVQSGVWFYFTKVQPGGRTVLYVTDGQHAQPVTALSNFVNLFVSPDHDALYLYEEGQVYTVSTRREPLFEFQMYSDQPISWFRDRSAAMVQVGTLGPTNHIVWLDMQTGSSEIVVSDTTRKYNVVLAPDSRHLAYVTNRNGVGRIVLMDLETRDAFLVPTPGEESYLPRWSPDSRYLQFMTDIIVEQGTESVLAVYDMQTGSSNLLMPDSWLDTRYATQVSWAPDSQHLTVITFNVGGLWELFLLNVQTLESTTLTGLSSHSVFAATWSHGGRYLAFGMNATLHIYDHVTGDIEDTGVRLTFRQDRLYWSPDDTQIALITASNFQDGIAVYDVRQGKSAAIDFDEVSFIGVGWVATEHMPSE